MDSDDDLLAAVARGDQESLRALYERHAEGMLRMVCRMTPSAAVAEELLQEAWLAVWRSAGSFRRESSVKSWLYGVARRQALSRLRRPEPPTSALDEARSQPDPGAGVEDVVIARAARGSLADAVRDLPAHLQEVVLLVLVDDLPYPDVAKVLGVPVGTVKSRMFHARRQLAEALSGSAANPRQIS